MNILTAAFVVAPDVARFVNEMQTRLFSIYSEYAMLRSEQDVQRVALLL